jgi:DNA-binding LacI/PurR family transcriptional regulator/DNA-binding transcriptional regulator YhcF (GntR family)
MGKEAANSGKRTKYEQVVAELALRIERGELKPDTPLPPIRELMRAYGYSLATITRAIAILESQGLLRSTRGKGIFVQPQRPTATKPLGTLSEVPERAFSPVWGRLRVGVLSTYQHPRAGEMWWSRILGGVDQLVRETGGGTQVRLIQVDDETPANVVQRCVNEGVNALLNLGDHWKGVELLALARAARERRLPVVMAWTSQPRPLPVHVLEMDNQIGVEEAVDHLVALGHRKIGFLRFGEAYAWVIERAESFRVAMEGHGLRPAMDMKVKHQTPLKADSELKALAKVCTAVVCANDDLAVELLTWAAAHGRTVPETLSVVGFDDDPVYRQFELTTVHDDLGRLGRESLRLLAQLVESGDSDMRLTLRLPARLVIRRTTAATRIDTRDS